MTSDTLLDFWVLRIEYILIIYVQKCIIYSIQLFCEWQYLVFNCPRQNLIKTCFYVHWLNHIILWRNHLVSFMNLSQLTQKLQENIFEGLICKCKLWQNTLCTCHTINQVIPIIMHLSSQIGHLMQTNVAVCDIKRERTEVYFLVSCSCQMSKSVINVMGRLLTDFKCFEKMTYLVTH